jgi:hypothetical protein
MAKYKVLKGNVGGFGGKMFAEGSICSDTDFPVGNAQDLEKMGYLQLVPETDEAEDVEVENVENVESATDTDTETETDEAEEKPLSIRSMDKPEIIQWLVAHDIEFDPAAKKEELYNLYVQNF